MEIFRKIEKYENYSVSNKGNIRNDKRMKLLKHNYTNGYNLVSLSKNNSSKKFHVSDLVKNAFNQMGEREFCDEYTEFDCCIINVNGEDIISYF